MIEPQAVAALTEKLCLRACCFLPEDVEAALIRSRDAVPQAAPARAVLDQIIENARLARERRRPICQDTGVTVVFADIGQDAHIAGDLYAAVDEGVRRAYCGGAMRKSVLGALSRVNTGDNTPAVVHLRFVAGDRLRLTVLPKGFGSENMSRVIMLTPADGTEGILNAITETVVHAGACACPPIIAGVGIGGTMDRCAALAKRQLLRRLDAPQPDPRLAELERQALLRINETGIGPMGLGGAPTALAVLIGEEPTHIAGLPVAVNLQCHACRRAEGVL